QGMEIAYSREHEPLGTGGAVRQAAAKVQGDGVHLANGDTWLRYEPVALEQATAASGALLGIALARVEDVGRYGAVEVEAGREQGGSGPGLINAGSYYLSPTALDRLPQDRSYSFEERVLAPWTREGAVTAFDRTSDFIDIGVPGDYARAQALFADVRG